MKWFKFEGGKVLLVLAIQMVLTFIVIDCMFTGSPPVCGQFTLILYRVFPEAGGLAWLRMLVYHLLLFPLLYLLLSSLDRVRKDLSK